MATLEDKILGEKREYYCSSSSDEEEENLPTTYKTEKLEKWNGVSSNTGPKGVLRDWERFKESEKDKRDGSALKQQEMMKKSSMVCRSALDEEEDKILENDPDLLELLTDDYLQEYQKQRMREMLDKFGKLCFGDVVHLKNSEEFLDAIDNENKTITVIIHIYDENVPGCDVMNGCLISLAKEYPLVKFCKIIGSAVNVSKNFKKEGIPALLVYKNGEVIGNFIHVTDYLGEDFFSTDVESFLKEHGFLNDEQRRPAINLCNKID